MALLLQLKPYFFTFVLIFSIFTNSGGCWNSKVSNVSMPEEDNSDWSPAAATWYGDANGAGSTGGACGYQDAVEQPPFNSMITAGGASLFKSGKGCGACYQVRCNTNNNGACSGNPITVVVTDECPGGPCITNPVHFDLSGTAFGAMAISGQANQLRTVGNLQIDYRKVSCSYPKTKLSFRIDSGANPYYFATLIEYMNGDGEIGSVELQQASDSTWQPMQQSWGAVWLLNSGSPLQAPFSLRITSLESGNAIEAIDVIPEGWQPGQTYQAAVNF